MPFGGGGPGGAPVYCDSDAVDTDTANDQTGAAQHQICCAPAAN